MHADSLVRTEALEPGTLFAAVHERLSRLIPRFGVEDERHRVLGSYELICRESLALGVRSRPPEFSRLNADGTPIQLSLHLSAARDAPLQFIAEAGTPASTYGERVVISRERMSSIAELFGAAPELAALAELLEQMAPEREPALEVNRSGVYWLGVSFLPAGDPALTIYINSKWGSPEAQWERMRAFASWFGAHPGWRSIEEQLRPRMAPLGTAITIARGRRPSGRLYASAYGLSLGYYRSLFSGFCADGVVRFVEAAMEEDYAYPLRSAACSFELSEAGGITGAKFELCAHCAFADDAQAAARCSAWVRCEGYNATLYEDTVRVLTGGQPPSGGGAPGLHAYVGTGVRGGHAYATLYLNPGPPLRGQ